MEVNRQRNDKQKRMDEGKSTGRKSTETLYSLETNKLEYEEESKEKDQLKDDGV